MQPGRPLEVSEHGGRQRPGEDPWAVLSLRGLVKRWNPAQTPVLDGLSLELHRGSALAVSGRNGVGKTTLLRIIAGLLTSDDGTTHLLGLEPTDDRREYMRRLGFLPAGNTGLYARLNVDQNLEFWARLALMPRRRRAPAIGEMLDLFDLGGLRNRRVDRLSMGQRQRLRLALAFLHDPDLVLLDEPCTSLDAEGAELVRAALDRLRSRGGAAIVCSPESERDRLRTDRNCLLLDGHLVDADRIQ